VDTALSRQEQASQRAPRVVDIAWPDRDDR
jgi:hypothetical protein